MMLPEKVAPTVGQQTYVILSGLAGGAAGMLLAYSLRDKDSIPTKTLLAASALSFVFTLIPAWMIAQAAGGYYGGNGGEAQ